MARLWANLILKVNRAQLRKRKVRKFKDMLSFDPTSGSPRYREVPKEELEQIKAEIRKEASMEIRREILRYVWAALAALLILLLFKACFGL
ncbi:hypothetical protein OZ410_09140 [Robiginitalea sp. M366]|uniref:hypothetical protein n=1 Tax=Robiginitalea aestuariiviva TaxID=3036903 RepID=UPI00240E1D99|nr:hypothetical protein [Robiginitalea aestuariiviva]MDG1572479.1 hypothetical protein [Robiginitalea aestuariiviva]